MSDPIDVNSKRAIEARLGKRIGRTGYLLLVTVVACSLVGATSLFVLHRTSDAFYLVALAIACYLPALWWKRYLNVLPPVGHGTNDRLSVDILIRLKSNMEVSPRSIWDALSDHWQSKFFSHRLLISAEQFSQHLSNDVADMSKALDAAHQLADTMHSSSMEVGFLVAGILLSEPSIHDLLLSYQLQPDDLQSLALWLGRGLDDEQRDKQDFGGVGRDWSFGFTPLLDRYGDNLSLSIAHNGAHYGWLTSSPGVNAIESAFDNHATAVALIGPDGIGKTTSIYALAQRLIEGHTSKSLAYRQIINLRAAVILSNAKGPGQLERIILALANEAAHAGHVILFFDDAQLFFSSGPGAFDASQLLLPILQSATVPIIFALSPQDYQRLRSSNTSLAGLLTPVILQELPAEDVMRVLEDIAIGIEYRNNVLITYAALRETYRLSGRYELDEAYPGKAIKLLHQSVAHAEGSIVTAHSVQLAIEQTRGVKVATAELAEASTLLSLEDRIHERMINQTNAVSAVANALRRARAGVGNPRRPIGSFLFLGPTGVGKTELAKAIATTYFNAESNIIRLDMSEYQQAEDVSRLLSTGQSDTASLIMSVRQQPFSVVLLDELEKAHVNVLNLLLQMLDEGQLTDQSGRSVSFKDCIIIATSNAGATTIRENVAQGIDLEATKEKLVDELVSSGQFKPELLNRFDELVLFRPLSESELAQVVSLMLKDLNLTLANQNITLTLTEDAIKAIVHYGYDPRLGARPMRRALQKAVENVVADRILRGSVHPGDTLHLDAADLQIGSVTPSDTPSSL